MYELHDAVDQVLLQLGGRTVDERGKVRNPRNKQTGRLAVQNIPRLPALVKQVRGTDQILTWGNMVYIPPSSDKSYFPYAVATNLNFLLFDDFKFLEKLTIFSGGRDV